MIPERTGITVDSTVRGEDIAMTIAADAAQHFMNMFTDLYEDRILACIREYSTNALDSHIQAGQTRPIEVTTPTALRPLLTIRDYGVGMDAEDIRTIYSQYGASTKRGSNDAVGMLGIGCKAALAYVDQFTLTGTKDGKRMQVSIARDETGAGTMTVLDSGDTDEPDGVEICIPTDDEYGVERKAEDFFSYWAPGKALLNGAEAAPLDGYAVGDYLVAPRGWNLGTRCCNWPLTVVMGNVAYPPPPDYDHEAVDMLPEDRRLVIRVPIGSVHFTPSRESLQDSAMTRAAIDVALAAFQPDVIEAVTVAITEAPTKPAAAKALIEARAAFGKGNVPELDWNGESIPTVLSAEDLDPVVKESGGVEYAASLWASTSAGRYSGGIGNRYAAGQISLDDAAQRPWVLNYSNAKWSATQRKKLNRYLEHHNLADEPHKVTVYITDSAAVPKPDWIDGTLVTIDWADVKSWKDPNRTYGTGGGSTKFAGTYPTVLASGAYRDKYPASELPADGRNLYYVADNYYTHDAKALLGDKAIVVSLTDARMGKFLRLFPHARPAVESIRKGAEGWYARLSDDTKFAIAMRDKFRYMHDGVLTLPEARVDDPELSKIIRTYKAWTTGDLRERFEKRARYLSLTTPDDLPEPNKYVSERYPLIAESYGRMINKQLEHALLYVNAAYAAHEGSK